MGARGATASSEAADIVLTTDPLERLTDAMDIARRARHIAVQSAIAGMALSLVAMIAAALGFLPPAAGALLQEAIDVTVILNALRALTAPRSEGPNLSPQTDALLNHFAAEHDELRGVLTSLRSASTLLSTGTSADALPAVRAAHMTMTERILPHERAEETQLYPVLATALGSSEAIAPMSRVHAEIERLTRRIGTHLAQIDVSGDVDPARVDDLLACLYGLHAVLALHFIQEEESYFALAATHPTGDP